MGLIYYSSIGFILSIALFIYDKHRIAIIMLSLTALVFYFSASLFDPFLNMWDERFHALVAKNMVKNPFKPMLYANPVLDMAYDRWDRYHIWLHKQPLFLWQIAISFKLFGINETALRLPNVLMAGLMVPISYRTGKLLANKHVGFYAALLSASSFYLLELVSGRQELEHNDVAFVLYISASIWSWLEYLYSPDKKKAYWLILIGLFSGFAILCKWLGGLLVFLGWSSYLFFQRTLEKRPNRGVHIQPIVLSLFIVFLIAAPWQIYTWIKFPEDKANEMSIYSGHIWKALDGHRGSFWYHLEQIPLLFGKWVQILIVPALVVLYFTSRKKTLALAVITMIIFVYLFYSLVQTKMPSFPFIIATMVWIALASVLDFLIQALLKIIKVKAINGIIVAVGLLLLIWYNSDIPVIQKNHDLNGHVAKQLMHNKAIFIEIKNGLPDRTVLFNVKGRHYIEAMFYTDFTAYNVIPNTEQISDLQKKRMTVAIFKPFTDSIDFPLSEKVIILEQELKGWD
ncbi:MAG: glycosyltransferase family 39 protein [Bacteroidales bacterium]|nr:glycosyltransferase family 39 protein [Bacteroidales bacterium]MCF8403198.1 glycosyltransferase family 39 protein [Bacteroidales bacterium]